MRTSYFNGEITIRDSVFEDYEYVLKYLADGYIPDLEYNERADPGLFRKMTWADILRNAFYNSIVSKTVLDKGVPVFVFGIVKLDEDTATLHNLSTQESVKKSVTFVKASRKIINEILNYPEVKGFRIVTFFRPDNYFGLRWAEHTGGKRMPYDYNGFAVVEWPACGRLYGGDN